MIYDLLQVRLAMLKILISIWKKNQKHLVTIATSVRYIEREEKLMLGIILRASTFLTHSLTTAICVAMLWGLIRLSQDMSRMFITNQWQIPILMPINSWFLKRCMDDYFQTAFFQEKLLLLRISTNILKEMPMDLTVVFVNNFLTNQ